VAAATEVLPTPPFPVIKITRINDSLLPEVYLHLFTL